MLTVAAASASAAVPADARRGRADSSDDEELPAFCARDDNCGRDVPETDLPAAGDAPAVRAPPSGPRSGWDAWFSAGQDPGTTNTLPRPTHPSFKRGATSRVLCSADTTALGLFLLVFPQVLVDRIVQHTSAKLVELGEGPLALSEFYHWLALFITMGVHRLPDIGSYWNTTSFGACSVFCACRLVASHVNVVSICATPAVLLYSLCLQRCEWINFVLL